MCALSVEYTPVDVLDGWEEAICNKRRKAIWLKSYLAEPLAGWQRMRRDFIYKVAISGRSVYGIIIGPKQDCVS